MTATGNAPVLAGVDGSESALRAVEWAARAATSRGCPLVLLAAVPVPAPYGAGVGLPASYFDELEAQGRRRLAEAEEVARRAAGARLPDLLVETEFHAGSAVPSLLERAGSARLLVLGTRGLGELTGTFVGSVAAALVSHAPCPVVLVRGRTPDDQLPEGPVVVGVDGSPVSDQALAAAFEEAALQQTGLVAVHVFSDVALPGAFDLSTSDLPSQDIETSERVVLAERLAGWQERYPQVKVERVVERDRPVRSLLKHADDAGLLVVGSRGRGGFSGMLLGSTSNALVHTAPCPLLIVRGRT